MDKLKITAVLKTPLVTGGGYMTMDGLLAALIFERTNDIEEAHTSIPIKCDRELYSASSAIFDEDSLEFNRDKIAFIASLSPNRSLDLNLLKKNKKTGDAHINVTSTEFINKKNSYYLVNTPEVSWYVDGDAEKIQSLLLPVEFIGKKRTAGFGEVIEWKFEPSACDGLYDENRKPLRPIPKDLYVGDRSLPLVDASWKPAYWDIMNRSSCYVPGYYD